MKKTFIGNYVKVNQDGTSIPGEKRSTIKLTVAGKDKPITVFNSEDDVINAFEQLQITDTVKVEIIATESVYIAHPVQAITYTYEDLNDAEKSIEEETQENENDGLGV